jgi:hypothetical protein
MALRTWVNDELHSILGFAESSTVDYIIALAKRAKNADDLLARFVFKNNRLHLKVGFDFYFFLVV